MESVALNHWESDWDEEGGGLATTSTQILANQVHTSSAQVLIPISSFVHLWNQGKVLFWPENSMGHSSAWFYGPFLNLFALALARNWTTTSPIVESVFWPHWTCRARENSLKQCGQWQLNQEVDIQRLSQPQCSRISFPLASTVLGHTASNNEDLEQKKSGGQQSKVYWIIVQSSCRGRTQEGCH